MPRDVAGCDVIDGVSRGVVGRCRVRRSLSDVRGSTSSAAALVVSWDVAGLDVIGGPLRRVVERRRLDVIGGVFAVSNVAWLELSTFLRVAGRRRVRRHRQSFLRRAMGRRRAR